MTWLTVMEYLCHKWPGYVPLVVNTSRSFPHSRLVTGFVTRLTRRLPLVEQELLTLPERLSSPPVFSGISFMCMFCRSLFVLLYFFFWPLFCLFFFDIRILITPLVLSSNSFISGNSHAVLFLYIDVLHKNNVRWYIQR
jgi:hypothetical protein